MQFMITIHTNVNIPVATRLSDNLKLHGMHHVEGNKTKMCDKCCKLFFHTSEVHAHMATHNIEKHFICEKCHKKFTHCFELNHHIKSCGQTVQCPMCPRKIKGGEKNLKTIWKLLTQIMKTGNMCANCVLKCQNSTLIQHSK